MQAGVSNRCIIQVYHADVSYRCIIQVYHRGVSYKCIIQVYHRGVSYRYIIQVYLTDVSCRCIVEVYRTGVIASYEFKQPTNQRRTFPPNNLNGDKLQTKETWQPEEGKQIYFACSYHMHALARLLHWNKINFGPFSIDSLKRTTRVRNRAELN